MPRQFSFYTPARRRLKTWEEDGTWERIWKKLLQILSRENKLKLEIAMIDGKFASIRNGGTWLVQRRKAKGGNGGNRWPGQLTH